MAQARRRAGLRTWAPIGLLLVVIVAVVAVVWVSVAANRPSVGRPDDVAIYQPQRRETMTDVVSGTLQREAGCTYLDADDGRRWLILFPDIGIRWDGDWLYVGVRAFTTERPIDVRGRIVKLPTQGISTDIPDACRGVSDFFLVKA